MTALASKVRSQDRASSNLFFEKDIAIAALYIIKVYCLCCLSVPSFAQFCNLNLIQFSDF